MMKGKEISKRLNSDERMERVINRGKCKYFPFLNKLVKSGAVPTMGDTDITLIKQYKELEIPGTDPSFYARRVIKKWSLFNMERYIDGDSTIWYDEDGIRHWKDTEEFNRLLEIYT